MRVVRGGCFETNSSSQHVIVVTKNDTHIVPEELNPDVNCDKYSDEYCYVNNGKLRVTEVDEGFGRYPFEILTTFKDKMRYAICEYLGRLYVDDPKWDEYYGELKRIATEHIPGFKDFEFYMKDVDIYLDKDGNEICHKDLIYKGWYDDHGEYTYLDKDGNECKAILDKENCYEMPDIGMIDHQSMGLLKNFLKYQGISLEEFLTNKKYAVVIDGDEYMEFDHLLRAGFIDRNFITGIYDKSGEDVEFQDWLKREKENEESN